MKKVIHILICGLTLCAGLLAIAGSGYARGREHSTIPLHSYRGHGTPERYDARHGRNGYDNRHERRVWKEIRKNERRMLKLERKIQKLLRKQHHRGGDYRYNDYSRKIHQLQREINHLQRRNLQLRQMLRR